MIQGDEVFEEDGGLSPDWKIWIDRYNGIRNRFVILDMKYCSIFSVLPTLCRVVVRF